MKLPKRMQLKSGTYWYVRRVDGRVKWTKLGRDYEKAYAEYHRLEDLHQRVSGRDFAALAADYALTVLPKLKPNTQRQYRSRLHTLVQLYGRWDPNMIDAEEVYRMLREYPHKIAANRLKTVLQNVLEHGRQEGWVKGINVCRTVRRNPERPRKRLPMPEEWDQLMGVSDKRWRLLLEFVRMTAARRGDLVKLTFSNVLDNELRYTIEKTGELQRIALTPKLRALIAEIRLAFNRKRGNVETTALFTTPDGHPYSKAGITTHFARLRDRAGIKDLRFHDIRALAITEMARKHGRDVAQQLARHSNGTQTETYIRAREQVVSPPNE